MPSLNYDSPSVAAYLGLILFLLGLLLVLGGLNIFKLLHYHIEPGWKTWTSGLLLLTIGVGIIVWDSSRDTARPGNPTPVPTEVAEVPTNTPSRQDTTTQTSAPAQPTIVVAPTASSPIPVPPTQSPPTPVPPTMPPVVVSQQLSRCDWLAANFPQSPDAIATQFGLPVNRIRMVKEGCGETANGFVVQLGPPIELVVDTTNGGCIDAPQDAVFSDATVPDTAGGLRAYSGTVRAVVMTYRPWC